MKSSAGTVCPAMGFWPRCTILCPCTMILESFLYDLFSWQHKATPRLPRPSIASCRNLPTLLPRNRDIRDASYELVIKGLKHWNLCFLSWGYARATIKFKMMWTDKSSWPSWIHLPRSALSQFIQLFTRIPKSLPLICDSVGRLCSRWCSFRLLCECIPLYKAFGSLFCHMLTIGRCYCWSLRLLPRWPDSFNWQTFKLFYFSSATFLCRLVHVCCGFYIMNHAAVDASRWVTHQTLKSLSLVTNELWTLVSVACPKKCAHSLSFTKYKVNNKL